MKLKIAMIGGGSYSLAYGLFSTFLDNPFFDKETELCLYDINEKALNDVYTFITFETNSSMLLTNEEITEAFSVA